MQLKSNLLILYRPCPNKTTALNSRALKALIRHFNCTQKYSKKRRRTDGRFVGLRTILLSKQPQSFSTTLFLFQGFIHGFFFFFFFFFQIYTLYKWYENCFLQCMQCRKCGRSDPSTNQRLDYKSGRRAEENKVACGLAGWLARARLFSPAVLVSHGPSPDSVLVACLGTHWPGYMYIVHGFMSKKIIPS